MSRPFCWLACPYWSIITIWLTHVKNIEDLADGKVDIVDTNYYKKMFSLKI